jgi:hypothetical protein
VAIFILDRSLFYTSLCINSILSNSIYRPFYTHTKTEFLPFERMRGYRDFQIAINFVALSKRGMFRRITKCKRNVVNSLCISFLSMVIPSLMQVHTSWKCNCCSCCSCTRTHIRVSYSRIV